MKSSLPRNTSSPCRYPTPPPGNMFVTLRRKIRNFAGVEFGCIAAAPLYVAISLMARSDFQSLPQLPEPVRQVLGSAPPLTMISTALIIYTCAVIFRTMTKMLEGNADFNGFVHIYFVTAFYGFYHHAEALEQNFWAVFTAGLTIVLLEIYNTWTISCQKARVEEGEQH